MSDPFSNQQAGSFPPPGQPSYSPTLPTGSPAPRPYGAPTEPLYTAPGGTPPGFLPPGAPSPMVGDEPPSRRSRGKMLGAVVGVAAVVAAGAFAFTQLRSNDSDGGAASPQEVGEQLVTAFDNEDILGAIDLLLPGERETFRQPMLDLVDELTRLQVTDDSADLSKVAGLDITMDNIDISVDETNVDDVAHVSLNGTASVSVDGRDLPIGDFLIETAFGGERPDVAEDSGAQEFDFSVASVEKDGRWYISLFYSAAEAARGDEDIPEEGIAPVGASSPQGALDNLIQYASNLDLENMIASLNPNEAEALQRYGPLFLGDAQDTLDDVDIVWELSDATYTETGSGDRRQVAIDGFHFEAQVEGETVEFDLEDGCLVGTTPQGEVDSCTALNQEAGSVDTALDQLGLADNESVRQLIEDTTEAFKDLSMHGVVVDKVDGSWYVSPIGTGAETVLSLLRALDRDEIETIINDVEHVIDTTFDDFSLPDMDAFPDDTFPDDTIPDDTIPDDTFPDDTIPDDTFPDDTVTDDTLGAFWYDCLTESAVSDDIAACVQAGVEDGTFDAEFIPAPYLFPDCGLLDYYNSEALYTDDPATFLATIEPGRQCIVDAAAAAGFDILYSSPEFLFPECYTMDNPWNFGEDNEVNGFDCALEAG